MALQHDLPLEEYHRAGREITNGNPEVYKRLHSRGDDVTLANPFGPPVRGRSGCRLRWTGPRRLTAMAKSSARRSPGRKDDDVVLGSVAAKEVEVDEDEHRGQAADCEAQQRAAAAAEETSTRLRSTRLKTAR
jgi:hypothetical protein